MRKKAILYVLVLLMFIYPAFALFDAIEAIGDVSAKEAENVIVDYEISVWVTWIVLVSVAVFFKWTRRRNLFFFFTYGYVIIAFGIVGYLSQMIISAYGLPSHFEDSYTLGVLIAVQKIVSAVILTAFLHAAVWWFTRRWHRR